MQSNLVLIGYRGTGKSAVARLLALRLARDWVDADVEIELEAGKSIAAIFADEGEAGFREREARALARLLTAKNRIVAAGGGAVLRDESAALVRAQRDVVWLRALPTTILLRIAADAATSSRRPNLTAAGGEAEVVELLARRTPRYAECATLVVDTDDKTPAEVADEIVARLDLAGQAEERA